MAIENGDALAETFLARDSERSSHLRCRRSDRRRGRRGVRSGSRVSRFGDKACRAFGRGNAAHRDDPPCSWRAGAIPSAYVLVCCRRDGGTICLGRWLLGRGSRHHCRHSADRGGRLPAGFRSSLDRDCMLVSGVRFRCGNRFKFESNDFRRRLVHALVELKRRYFPLDVQRVGWDDAASPTIMNRPRSRNALAPPGSWPRAATPESPLSPRHARSSVGAGCRCDSASGVRDRGPTGGERWKLTKRRASRHEVS